MNKYALRIILSLLLCPCVALPLWAQKTTKDARTLQKPDLSHIPKYGSIEAYLQSRPAADLRSSATEVGHARRVSQALTPQTVGTGLARPGDFRLQRAPNGTVRWMQGELGQISRPSAGKQALEAQTEEALEVLDGFAGLLGLDDPQDELRPMQTVSDELGYIHARFEQLYEGIPVWGRDLFVHVNDRGDVYAVNGTYEPTPRRVGTTPTMGGEEAIDIVVGDLQARERWAPVDEETAAWLGFGEPEARLVFYPDEGGVLALAYEVSLHPNFLEWFTYLVDAHEGRVLNRIARHCTLHHDQSPRPPAQPVSLQLPHHENLSGTFVNAVATDLNNTSQNLRVYQHDDGFFYKLWDLPNLNQAQSSFPNDPAGGALTISANNTDFGENVNLTHVTSNNNSWNDASGVSAHVNMQIAYEYYKTKHDRNAIDGKDQSIISVIHVTDGGQPMDNAFWNGRVMAYGDGAQAFTPLAGALDVAGHEMTHGVIQNTADLVYQFQSGALNESFADVFGFFIEPNDFLLGEDVTRQALALRDLKNPNSTQVLAQQPAHMSQYVNLTADQDNGGVHINSGIPNRAAALIIESLGLDASERIYYRALTMYLTRNSQFGDARNAVEQAAVDFFGQNSNAASVVRQSFDEVGITATQGGDTGGDGGNDVPAQTGGSSLITFLLEDGRIGGIDWTDPNNVSGWIFEDAKAIARVDVENGDRSQLTTPRTGADIWFINADNKLAFVNVSSGAVQVFENLFLAEEGDLWNASISPDGNFVALVSAYAEDPTLYIYDGNQVAAIELKPETTQEGIQDESIQYPDVVSWSPNPQVPRIAFDAFNEVSGGTFGNTISYWSMYEIDFSAGNIFNLIPAQPSDVSVGNVTYSNTNPDVIAFNFIDDTWDVVVGNFEEGTTTELGIPNFTLEGSPINDASRPSFSPDDSEISFTSAEHGVLLFYNLASGGLTFLDIENSFIASKPYNAKWFTFGGSGGTQNSAPTAQFSATGAGGLAPFLIGLDASASSDPNGDELTYRWDFGDGSVGSGATTAHTYFSTGTFIITLTVTDSGGLSDQASLEIGVTGVDVETDDELPRVVALYQNHPNPFNPATVLRFDVPAAMQVELRVVDLMGRTVATLVNDVQQAGTHEVHFEAEGLPTGIYLAQLRAGSTLHTRKMVLLR